MPTDPIAIIQNPQAPVWRKISLILQLAKQQDQTAYSLILAMMEDPVFSNVRGTLVCALKNYPPEPLFDPAIHWLITGNFEMAHEAWDILNGITELTGGQVAHAYTLLLAAANNTKTESWRIELLQDALNWFG